MDSKIKNILIPLLVVLVLGIQQTKAQKVTKSNGVEYLEKATETNDLNTIKVPVKSLKKKKLRKVKKSIRTVADLERIVQRRKNLRFRNKRRSQEKCYSHTEEKCETKE
ncbi:hypothetical protein [Tenacibaculum jejuense]|uniref:Uncharacterized protein n=1 Tax=Tenacibaculum jejuense TaxID=584609 RepID=A0A238UCX4_9FLAO|nr:hypothetical protein [Tenacibaculum jejuense]SNR17021.1 protein of unknown function [Tenacibaculum jejuense]